MHVDIKENDMIMNIIIMLNQEDFLLEFLWLTIGLLFTVSNLMIVSRSDSS